MPVHVVLLASRVELERRSLPVVHASGAPFGARDGRGSTGVRARSSPRACAACASVSPGAARSAPVRHGGVTGMHRTRARGALSAHAIWEAQWD
ncbi:hypothetical protein AAII07_05130 [Microvirga sp. 0TCS3.31]